MKHSLAAAASLTASLQGVSLLGSGQLSPVPDNQQNLRERSRNSGPNALQFEDITFI